MCLQNLDLYFFWTTSHPQDGLNMSGPVTWKTLGMILMTPLNMSLVASGLLVDYCLWFLVQRTNKSNLPELFFVKYGFSMAKFSGCSGKNDYKTTCIFIFHQTCTLSVYFQPPIFHWLDIFWNKQLQNLEEFFRARLPTQRARSLRYKVSVSGCCGAAAKIWKMYSCTAFAGEQKETWETSTFASFFFNFCFLFYLVNILFFSVFENVCRKFANQSFFPWKKKAEIHAEVMMKVMDWKWCYPLGPRRRDGWNDARAIDLE